MQKMNILKKYKKQLLWLLDLTLNVVIVFGIVLLVERFLVTPFDIYGPSMCDNLNIINEECTQGYGEKIIINKAGYYIDEPDRGDIIIFKPRFSDEKYFIKRIIGLPGETVEIINGYVYVTNDTNPTGTKLEEPYLSETNSGKTKSFPKGGKIFQVPEGEYFVLGDNRNASTDSRSCFHNPYNQACTDGIEDAFVPRNMIAGRAWFSFWPIANWRTLEVPEYPELD
jgi:signal peptidase I